MRNLTSVICLIVVLASPAIAQVEGHEELKTWEESWNDKVTTTAVAVLKDARSGTLASLGDADKKAALAELKKIIEDAIGWAAMEETFVNNMYAVCGGGFMMKVEPMFTGKADFSGLDEATAISYAQCGSVAVSMTQSVMLERLEARIDDIAAVHHKYGVDYP